MIPSRRHGGGTSLVSPPPPASPPVMAALVPGVISSLYGAACPTTPPDPPRSASAPTTSPSPNGDAPDSPPRSTASSSGEVWARCGSRSWATGDLTRRGKVPLPQHAVAGRPVTQHPRPHAPAAADDAGAGEAADRYGGHVRQTCERREQDQQHDARGGRLKKDQQAGRSHRVAGNGGAELRPRRSRPSHNRRRCGRRRGQGRSAYRAVSAIEDRCGHPEYSSTRERAQPAPGDAVR